MEECKLCGSHAELRRSHIIPEFFFRSSYGPGHRLLDMRTDGDKPRFRQNGFRERLLCSNCEHLLNIRYEQPTKRCLYDDASLPDEIFGTGCRFLNVPYNSFKLCHLSIIWRAGVAASEVFSQVNLGKHEQQLRKMLLSGDAGPASLYQLIGTVLLWPGTRRPAFAGVMPPVVSHYRGSTAYLSMYGAIAWLVLVEGDFPELSELVLTEAGEMFLPTQSYEEFAPMRNALSLFFEHADRAGWRNPWKQND